MRGAGRWHEIPSGWGGATSWGKVELDFVDWQSTDNALRPYVKQPLLAETDSALHIGYSGYFVGELRRTNGSAFHEGMQVKISHGASHPLKATGKLQIARAGM